MKKKIFIASILVCLFATASFFTVKAEKLNCRFLDGGKYYVCLLKDCVCDSAPADCVGIKVYLMDERPKPIDPYL